MISEALHKPVFGILVSFMLGLAIVMVVAPICKGTECMILKAPPINEVDHTVYHIASKCYKFEAYGVDCPPTGAIEAFQSGSR